MLCRLVLEKEKWKFLVSTSELYLVVGSIYSIQGTEKPYFLLLMTVLGGRVYYQALARVLLCLVIAGVPQASWAVRYLDKLRWRAVLI